MYRRRPKLKTFLTLLVALMLKLIPISNLAFTGLFWFKPNPLFIIFIFPRLKMLPLCLLFTYSEGSLTTFQSYLCQSPPKVYTSSSHLARGNSLPSMSLRAVIGSGYGHQSFHTSWPIQFRKSECQCPDFNLPNLSSHANLFLQSTSLSLLI